MTFERSLLPDPSTYFEQQGLKMSGPRSAKWKTTECQFHGGSDSMRVNSITGFWVCMACSVKGGDVLAYHMQRHGMDFVDAARALGAWHDDGKPKVLQKPAPLPPRAALQVLTCEANFVAIAAGNVAHGVALTQTDYLRLLTAANRIIRLVDAYS